GAEVEPEQERVGVSGRLGGEEDGGGQVVEKHGGDGTDPGCGPLSTRVEEVGRRVPEPGGGAEADREREQERERARVEAGSEAAYSGGAESDREHGDGRVRQRHQERRRDERRKRADSYPKRRQ